jgi:hypothetical protein
MIRIVKGRFPIFLAVGGVIGLAAFAGASLVGCPTNKFNNYLCGN